MRQLLLAPHQRAHAAVMSQPSTSAAVDATVEFVDRGNQPGPAGLVTGAQPSPVVAVEVDVVAEQHIVALVLVGTGGLMHALRAAAADARTYAYTRPPIRGLLGRA